MIGHLDNYSTNMHQSSPKWSERTMKNPGLISISSWKLFLNRKKKDNGKMIKLNTVSVFYNQRQFIANVIRKYQKQYYNEALLEHKYDAKGIFKIINKLLFKGSLPVPSELSIKLLADNFNNFFIAKNR